jgi:lipoyl-dependent peroxiredoxin subunit D
MNTLEQLRDAMPDFARDTKINLGTVLTTSGAPDLSEEQVRGVALASAYATRNPDLIQALEGEFAPHLDASVVNAAKASAVVMAMNNTYYRFVHLVHDEDISGLPAKLRMNIIANPGIAKLDFELMSLAVSALNGCGMCMESHLHEVVKNGTTKQGAQSAVRIASVVQAAAQALVLRPA